MQPARYRCGVRYLADVRSYYCTEKVNKRLNGSSAISAPAGHRARPGTVVCECGRYENVVALASVRIIDRRERQQPGGRWDTQGKGGFGLATPCRPAISFPDAPRNGSEQSVSPPPAEGLRPEIPARAANQNILPAEL